MTFLPLAALMLAPRAVQHIQPETTTYQVVFFKRGTAAPAAPDPAARMQAYVAETDYLADLARKRIMLIWGAFGRESRDGLTACAILAVSSAAEARQAFAGDPSVKSGMTTLVIRPWAGPKNWFAVPTSYDLFNPLVLDPFVLALVEEGPDRSQDAETARKLDDAHRTYMGSQIHHDPLVLAGSFLDDGPIRGILVYRSQFLNQVEPIAYGEDPAFGAGRLKLEVFRWMTLRGALR